MNYGHEERRGGERMPTFTVRSDDTSVRLGSAREALKEVEKLAVYEIIAVVTDENDSACSIEDLRSAAQLEMSHRQ